MARKLTSLQPGAPNFSADEAVVDGFTLGLRAGGRAEKTLQTYGYSLKTLRRFQAARNMPPLIHLTTEHLREYFNEMYARGCKPAGISVRYRAIRQFYRWLVDEGEREDNPLDRIPAPRVPDTLQPHYTDRDVNAVLKAIGGATRDPLSLRDRAILLTLYDTGLRGGELCSLRSEDLDWQDLNVRVFGGKGGKDRLVGVSAITAQAVERYHRRRQPSPWLFASREGRSLTFNALRNLLRRVFKKAGVEFRGVHAFRRGFAIAFLAAGGEPMDLKALAGWESMQMLRRYTKATETERAIKAHRRFSPVTNLDRP